MPADSQRCSLRAVVSGLVQGVFYRMFALRAGQSLGLVGTVRNLPDGRVEVRAEGDRARLQALIERLRQGPPRSQVQSVEEDWGECTREFDDFHIEY